MERLCASQDFGLADIEHWKPLIGIGLVWGVQLAMRWLEQALPFSFLCLLVFLQQHWLGLIAFASSTLLLLRANDVMKRQARPCAIPRPNLSSQPGTRWTTEVTPDDHTDQYAQRNEGGRDDTHQ